MHSQTKIPPTKKPQLELDKLIRYWANWWVKNNNTRLEWVDGSGSQADKSQDVFGKKVAVEIIPNADSDQSLSCKISGSIVISSANKIFPGEKYANVSRLREIWAIPFSQVFKDILELLAKENPLNFSPLPKYQIDNDTVTFYLKSSSEDTAENVLTDWKRMLKAQFAVQFNNKPFILEGRPRIVEFYATEAKRYIQDHFKNEKKPAEFEDIIVTFLETKGLIGISDLPFTYETVCQAIARYFDMHGTLHHMGRESLHDDLLETICWRYLRQFLAISEVIQKNKGEKIYSLSNIGHLSGVGLFWKCDMEIRFLELLAFKIVKYNKAEFTEKDLQACFEELPDSKGIDMPTLLQAQINFGVLRRIEIINNQQIFCFNSILLKNYLAARYLASFLNQAKLTNLLNHSWCEKESVTDYIRGHDADASHQAIWKLVLEILLRYENEEPWKKFKELIGKIGIKPSTGWRLKEKLAKLPAGYVLNLAREVSSSIDQLTITCIKDDGNQKRKLQNLILLYDNFECMLAANGIKEEVELILNDACDELIIRTKNSAVMDEIAQTLKAVSNKLNQIPSSHAFFQLSKKKSNDGKDVICETSSVITCAMQ